MGSNCTTPKSKGIIPSRKSKITQVSWLKFFFIAKGTISPLSTAKSAGQCFSFSEQSKFLPPKVPSCNILVLYKPNFIVETLPNIESLETLSLKNLIVKNVGQKSERVSKILLESIIKLMITLNDSQES